MRRTPRVFATLGVAVLVTASALAQAPAPTAPAIKSTSLGKYIPRDGLLYYGEFQGIDAHASAWGKSAASQVLNETTAGAMLEDVLTQSIARWMAPPPPPPPAPGQNPPPPPPPPDTPRSPLTPEETVAILKFAAKSGVVTANYKKEGTPKHVMVFPGAMRDDASKKVFAPMIRGLTPAGGKSEIVKKPGGRSIVVSTHPNGRVEANFWVENKTDLVIADDADAVIAAIDGTAPNAETHPTRVQSIKGEPGEETLGMGWVEADTGGFPIFSTAFPGGLDPSAVKQITYRIALRGSSLVHDLRLIAPKPRSGALALVDGPKFDVKSLPALPEGVNALSAFSLDFAKAYGQVVALAKAANPSSEATFAAIESSVKSKTRLRLREDVLGRLGPKVVVYASTKKAPGASAGFLSALGSGGLQVPKGAMLIEMKDAKGVTSMLDQLMIVANREMKAQLAASAPSEKGSTGKTSAKGKAAVPAGTVPEFKVTLNSPKTYSLTLPASLGAMTNLRLTLVVGKKSLIVATMPDAAKEALAAESRTAGRALAGDSAKAVEGLPSSLMMLQVWDPRETLPEGLAKLPGSINLLLAPKPPGGANPVAANGPQSPPNGSDAAQVAGAGRRPGGRGAPGNELPSASTGNGGTSNGPNGGVNPPAQGANAAMGDANAIRIDSAKIPSIDDVRKRIGPGSAAVAVDDQSIRFVVRHSFPDLGFWASLPGSIEALKGIGANGPAGLRPPPGANPPGAAAPAGTPGRRGGGSVSGID